MNTKKNILESNLASAKQKFNLKSWHVLIALLILGFAWRAFFIYRDVSWLTNYWLFEDFGYSLKIAKNIALGLGETFDGVVPTNGYQPLYVWLMVPVFWVFKTDLITPIYVAVTLLAVANVATGIFIYSILKRLTGEGSWALLGVSFWMFNLAIAKDGTNGLEAGLSTMMVAATIDYYLKIDIFKLGMSKAVTLGLLLGLSFLARVDAVFLAAAVFIMMLWPNPASLKDRIAFSAVTGVSFLLIAAPYAIWNFIHFASPLPTSGQVTTGKSSLFDFSQIGLDQIFSNVQYGLFIIGRMLTGVTTPGGVVVIGPSGHELYVPLLTCILFFLSAGTGIKGWKGKERKTIITTALIMFFYAYGYTIHSFIPFERYFLPIVLGFTILVSASLAIYFRNIWFCLILSGVLFLFFIKSALPFVFTKNLYTPGWFAGVQRLNEISKSGDIVGASQSGNLGYFYTNGRAINLDGVVNLASYQFRKNGIIDKYIYENNIKYLADEGNWIFILADQIKNPVDRRNFYARLSQRHSATTYAFSIYELAPALYASISKLPPSSSWKEAPHSAMIDTYALRSDTPGDKLQFSASKCFDLKFLKHDWSGIVKVFKDGVLIREIDLFSKVQDPTYKEFFSQDLRPHSYILEVSDKKNPASAATQVWLDAILERQNCKQEVGK